MFRLQRFVDFDNNATTAVSKRVRSYVPRHSGVQALQLQRLENKGQFRIGPLSRVRLPMHPRCKLLTLGGLTTTGSKRQFAGLEIETCSQSWRSRAPPFEAGFTVACPM